MPDDKIPDSEVKDEGLSVAEQETEALSDEESLAVFDEVVDADESGKETESDKAEEKAAEGKEEKSAEGDDEKSEEKGEKKEEEKEPTALEVAENLAKEIEGQIPTDEKATDDDGKKSSASQEGEGERATSTSDGAPSSSPLTKEKIAEYLAAIPDDVLPEGEIIIGDETINLREFKNDWPDQFNVLKVMAGMIAEQNTGAAMKGAQEGAVDADEVSKLKQRINNLEYFGAIARGGHPDVETIAASKEFYEWRDNVASRSLRYLAMHMRTPEDGIAIMDAYKEYVADGKAKEHDDEAAEKKKETDDLHKGTVRDQVDTSKVGADDGEVTDPEAEFNDAAEEEDKKEDQ
jgi:hypothetical protein